MSSWSPASVELLNLFRTGTSRATFDNITETGQLGGRIPGIDEGEFTATISRRFREPNRIKFLNIYVCSSRNGINASIYSGSQFNANLPYYDEIFTGFDVELIRMALLVFHATQVLKLGRVECGGCM
jgi:hypothetical protein